MLACLCCVLMVWHAVMFFLMTCYREPPHRAAQLSPPRAAQSNAATMVLGFSAFLTMLNWALWRDFGAQGRESRREPADLPQRYAVLELHKSGTIKMCRYRELGGTPATCCVVCLQDFEAPESIARLPCGHIFHPTCLHKWILQDWRCPFRCDLDVGRQEQAKPPESRTHAVPWLPRGSGEAVDVEAGR